MRRIAGCLARLGLASLWVAGAIQVAAAQTATRLAPGVSVRVTRLGPDAGREVGVYRGLTDSTLLLGAGPAGRSIPLASIGRLEWHDGYRPSIAGGVGGFVLGVAVGGLAGCAANRDSYGVFCAGQNDTKLAVAAALGGVAGAALGALLFKRRRWRELSVDRLRIDGPGGGWVIGGEGGARLRGPQPGGA